MLLNKKEKIWGFYEKKNLRENISNSEMYFSNEEKDIMKSKEKKTLIESKTLILLGIGILILLNLDKDYFGLFWRGGIVDKTRIVIFWIIGIMAGVSLVQAMINRRETLKLIEISKGRVPFLKIDFLKFFKIIIIAIYLSGIGVFLTNGGLSTNYSFATRYGEMKNYQVYFILGNILLIIYLFIKNIYYYMIKKAIIAAVKNFSKAIDRGGVEEVYKSVDFEGNNMFFFGEDYSLFFKVLSSLLTKVKNIQKEKDEILRYRAEVITNASHDIKTPITSIKNYIYIVENENTTIEEKRKYIEILKKKCEGLKKLIENLKITVYEIESSQAVKLEKINLLTLIENMRDEYKEELAQKNIEIKMQNNKKIIVVGNIDCSKKIFRNIFSNILKYGLEESRVNINIVEKEKEIDIEIENKIKEKIELSEKDIIKRFSRGDKSRHTEGHGLGLDIIKTLMQKQNGDFSIKIKENIFKNEIKYLK